MSASVQFSPVDMIKDSWGAVTANAGPLIGGFVLTMIISIGAGFIPFGSLVVQGPLQFGLYTVALAASRGKTVEFTEVFAGFQRFVPAFVAGLLIGIFTMIGAILCVIPGIIVAILYLPTYLYMIEEGLDFWPAMEKSRAVVWENFGQWLLLGLALFVLNFIGALACGVGLLITGPMSLVVICRAFDLQRGGRPSAPPSLDAALGQ